MRLARHSGAPHAGVSKASAVRFAAALGRSRAYAPHARRSVAGSVRKPRPATTSRAPPETRPAETETEATCASKAKRHADRGPHAAPLGSTTLPLGAKSTGTPPCRSATVKLPSGARAPTAGALQTMAVLLEGKARVQLAKSPAKERKRQS